MRKIMLSDSSRIGLRSGHVELYPHQQFWEENAESTILLIKSILGDICIDARHVGSTAINGIYAKPIIDIAVAVNNLDEVYQYNDVLAENGIIYRKVEETGQLLFIKGNLNDDIKTHHIHVVPTNSSNWRNYIIFRDYLNFFPEKAEKYNALKLSLAEKYPDNRKAYTAGKADLIVSLIAEANQWAENNKQLHK